MIFNYLKLLIYFHFLFRIRFFTSSFKRKYLPKGILIDISTTKKFYKNLKSIAIFNYWYQALHQRTLSSHDIINTYYYPLLWTLQDEQTDMLDSNIMVRFTLLKQIRSDLRERVPNKFVFDALGSNLVQMQIKSQIQKENAITLDQLEKIEEEKAGYSFPFYACLIDFAPIENQFQILYDFGIILQHIDDCLDIYEDTIEKTKTVANSLKLSDFEQFLDNKIDLFLESLQQIKASKKTLLISLICFSVGLVQIQNLKKITSQLHRNNYLEIDRKYLICDMAKFENIYKSYQITKAKYKLWTKS